MGESMVGAKPKLTFEEYAIFFDSMDRRFLSVDQLNQIVSMHGFARFRTKKAIMASLRPLNLMPPWRSTIEDSMISPFDTALALDDIKEDIAAIGWQDCPVNSIITARSGEEWVYETGPNSSSSAAVAAQGIKKRRTRKMRRLISIAAVAAASPVTPSWAVKKRRSSGRSPLADAGSLLLLADHAESASRT
ncbi:hypothetical protein IHE45_06G008600 [Dioscorea alata]|uniref:Uncharacterized protein n=1 Tax=Dioscorea alata TaxID=55571 RepID=A0ACB7VVB2_DIOAL|nr:hypothetical protein IHE45_06G008600 [Dioscorea alata]